MRTSYGSYNKKDLTTWNEQDLIMSSNELNTIAFSNVTIFMYCVLTLASIIILKGNSLDNITLCV